MWPLYLALTLLTLGCVVALAWPLFGRPVAVAAFSSPRVKLISGSWWGKIGILIILPLAAALMYYHLGSADALARYKWDQQHHQEITSTIQKMGGITGVTAQLVQRLAANPNQPEGWFLLGKLYLSQQQYANAYMAFNQANALQPNQTKIMSALVNASFLLHDQRLTPETKAMVQTLIAQAPNDANVVVMSNLLALDAYHRGHYTEAAQRWEKLLPYFAEDSEDQKTLLQMIAAAQKKQ